MHRLRSSLLALFTASAAWATPFTETSPTANGLVPVGVTAIGGIVLDIRGLNGAELTAQRAASGLYVGYASSNPFTIGVQTGLTSALLGQLGGGFAELAVRVTLLDGDTGPGNFDYNQNTFLINGISIGNWSSVATQQTNSTGTTVLSSGTGFRNNLLDTGWFHVTNATTLSSLYSSILSAGSATYGLSDVDWGDNYYDFSQGVNGSLINTNIPPVVSNTPDASATFGLVAAACLGLLGYRRRRA